MTVNVLCDARYGRMLVNQNDIYVGAAFVHCGEFSEHEVAAFRALVRPGDTVFDIGANIGAHTVPLAQLVGEKGYVLAFEPQIYQFQLLTANVALNDLWNVRTYNLALGAQPGVVKIAILDPRQRENFGGLSLGDGISVIAVTTLDSAQLEALDFIKIDVEGMELAVLQGGEQTIAKHRPVLYVEADREAQRAPLSWWLREHGYTIHEHTPPLWNDANMRGATDCPWGSFDAYKGIVSINWLCMPDGREPPPLDYLRALSA